MAVNTAVKSTKVVLKLEKGSQTISGCKADATDEALFNLGKAVGSLEKLAVDSMTKVVETSLEAQ